MTYSLFGIHCEGIHYMMLIILFSPFHQNGHQQILQFFGVEEEDEIPYDVNVLCSDDGGIVFVTIV